MKQSQVEKNRSEPFICHHLVSSRELHLASVWDKTERVFSENRWVMNTEKVSKVLSQVLDNEELENGIEFYEELFITTLEGTPVAYVSRQDAICREYGYIVTACALFSAMWNTLSEHARHSGYVSVPTVNFLVHFMQFGYLLFVWKLGHSYAPYLVEATLHLVSRGLAFFFSPKVSEVRCGISLSIGGIILSLFLVCLVEAAFFYFLQFSGKH